MNRKAFHRVALWAAGSFALGLSLVVPHSLNAVASNDAASVINQPKFMIGNCSVTLESNYPDGKTAWATGDKPNFKIAAVNSSDQDRDLTFNVSISATPPTSERSRTIPMPREVESMPVSLHVPAGKTATADLTCEKTLPAGSINVLFKQGETGLLMTRITTANNVTFVNTSQLNVNQINVAN